MAKAWNWRLWVGFMIGLLAPFGYFSLFEITRFALWIALLLFVVAIVLLIDGLKRVYSAPAAYRGRIAGPTLTAITILIIGLFGFALVQMKKAYPVGGNAPRVGQKAPEFLLTDTKGAPVRLAELLSSTMGGTSAGARPPRGVLLVFYRGHW